MSKYSGRAYPLAWVWFGYTPNLTYSGERRAYVIEKLSQVLDQERERTGVLCYILLADQETFRRLQQKANRTNARLFSLPREDNKIVAICNQRIIIRPWGKNIGINEDAWTEAQIPAKMLIEAFLDARIFRGGRRRVRFGKPRSSELEKGQERKESAGRTFMAFKGNLGSDEVKRRVEEAGFDSTGDLDEIERMAEFVRGLPEMDVVYVVVPNQGIREKQAEYDM